MMTMTMLLMLLTDAAYKEIRRENLIWVFTGDSCSNHMSFRQRLVTWADEVNDTVGPWLLTIQHANVFYTIQRYTHCYLLIWTTQYHRIYTLLSVNINNTIPQGIPIAICQYEQHNTTGYSHSYVWIWRTIQQGIPIAICKRERQ